MSKPQRMPSSGEQGLLDTLEVRLLEASEIPRLCQVAHRINADWQRRYGHPIYLLETFVQQDRFEDTCYQAANWIQVGQTTGRTRQDRHNRVNAPFEEIYLYPLTRHAQRHLCR